MRENLKIVLLNELFKDILLCDVNPFQVANQNPFESVWNNLQI